VNNVKNDSEWERLEAMVDKFAAEMKARLYQKKQEGYSGWDDPEELPGLARRAYEDSGHVWYSVSHPAPGNRPGEPRKCVDAANRLAMVWHIRSKEANGE